MIFRKFSFFSFLKLCIRNGIDESIFAGVQNILCNMYLEIWNLFRRYTYKACCEKITPKYQNPGFFLILFVKMLEFNYRHIIRVPMKIICKLRSSYEEVCENIYLFIYLFI